MINTNYTPSFGSRNKIIRDADAVCRTVKNEFPSISPTMLESRLKIEDADGTIVDKYNGKFDGALERCGDAISESRSICRFFGGVDNLINIIKKYKVMNCGENARLAETISLLNNAENISTFVVYKYNKKEKVCEDVDHMVAVLNCKLPEKYNYFYDNLDEITKDKLVKLSKGSVVIDPWIGFADFADNAMVKFKQEYAKLLNIGTDDDVFFIPTSNPQASDKELNIIKENHPALMLKNIDLNV